MNTGARSVAVAAILLCSVAMSGATARAQPAPAPAGAPGGQATPSPQAQEEARARFNRGLTLADDGDFDAALLELQRAYELAPSYRILYDVGVVSQQLKRYAHSYDAYERYLREGGAEVPPERVEEVRRRMDRLKERIAYVIVTSQPAGADVLVDDVPVGLTPLTAPLRVSSGQRKISVKLGGHPLESRVVELAGGEQKAVAFDLNAPASQREVRSPVLWISWGATAALTAGAVTTGILAITSTKSYDDVVNTPGVTGSQVSSAWSKAHTFALTTDVLGSVAIAAAAASVYFTLRPPSAHKSSTGLVILPGAMYGSF